MKLTKEQQAYLDICEKNGWSYDVFAETNEVELSQSSPAGEDFSFTVSLNDLADEVYSFLSNFDVDEHVEMWISARRAGVSGVPNTLALADDAEAIEQMLEELSSALYGRSSMNKDNNLKGNKAELLAEYQAVMVDICRSLGADPRVDISDPTYFQEVIDNAVAGLREPSLKNAVVLKQAGDDALLFTGNNVEPFVVALGYNPERKDWSAGTYYADLHQAVCDFDKQFGTLGYSYNLSLDDLYPLLEEKGYEPTHENVRALMLNTNDFEGVSEYINENFMMLFDGEIASVEEVLEQSPFKTMPEKSFHARAVEEIQAQKQSHKPKGINPKDDLSMGREAASQHLQDHNHNIGRSR